MYPKDDKKRLYQLIDMFITNKITALVFCNEFYYSYDLEIDDHSLTNEERKIFSDLSIVSSRFSQFSEDYERYPGVYINETELKDEILKIKSKLKV